MSGDTGGTPLGASWAHRYTCDPVGQAHLDQSIRGSVHVLANDVYLEGYRHSPDFSAAFLPEVETFDEEGFTTGISAVF